MEITTKFGIGEAVVFDGRRDKIDEIDIQIAERFSQFAGVNPAYNTMISYHLEVADRYVQEHRLSAPSSGVVSPPSFRAQSVLD